MLAGALASRIAVTCFHANAVGCHIITAELGHRASSICWLVGIMPSDTITSPKSKAELIWASPRELLNVFQADSIGCHIITATNDILKKLSLVGRDLEAYSLETVEMFYKDAKAAGYTIAARAAA